MQDLKSELRKHLADMSGGFDEFKSYPYSGLVEDERVVIAVHLRETVFH